MDPACAGPRTSIGSNRWSQFTQHQITFRKSCKWRHLCTVGDTLNLDGPLETVQHRWRHFGTVGDILAPLATLCWLWVGSTSRKANNCQKEKNGCKELGGLKTKPKIARRQLIIFMQTKQRPKDQDMILKDADFLPLFPLGKPRLKISCVLTIQTGFCARSALFGQ